MCKNKCKNIQMCSDSISIYILCPLAVEIITSVVALSVVDLGEGLGGYSPPPGIQKTQCINIKMYKNL